MSHYAFEMRHGTAYHSCRLVSTNIGDRMALHYACTGNIICVVPLAGLEPTHLASEASALSSELQGHIKRVIATNFVIFLI